MTKWQKIGAGIAVIVCMAIGMQAGLSGNVLAAVMTINVLVILRENLELERSHAEVVRIAKKALALVEFVQQPQPGGEK